MQLAVFMCDAYHLDLYEAALATSGTAIAIEHRGIIESAWRGAPEFNQDDGLLHALQHLLESTSRMHQCNDSSNSSHSYPNTELCHSHEVGRSSLGPDCHSSQLIDCKRIENKSPSEHGPIKLPANF